MRKILLPAIAVAALFAAVSVASAQPGPGSSVARVWFFGHCDNQYPDGPTTNNVSNGSACRGFGVFFGDWDRQSMAEEIEDEASDEFYGQWLTTKLIAYNLASVGQRTQGIIDHDVCERDAPEPANIGGFGLWLAWFSVEPCLTPTLHATKIVCDDADYLPPFGDSYTIDENTVADFLAEGDTAEHCAVDPTWQFQWTAVDGVNDFPADENLIGPVAGWNTFAGSVVLWPEDFTDWGYNPVYVREVVQEGDWVDFMGEPYTAVFGCDGDWADWDNRAVVYQDGSLDHYCVAWNAPEPEEVIEVVSQ
jgi:hypothetical protein